MSVSAAFYRQRNPQSSPYYQRVEDHFEAFEHMYEERFERRYGFFRTYVKDVIHRYLDCGILGKRVCPYLCVETSAIMARDIGLLHS